MHTSTRQLATTLQTQFLPTCNDVACHCYTDGVSCTTPISFIAFYIHLMEPRFCVVELIKNLNTRKFKAENKLPVFEAPNTDN